jgi:flagellar basal-body rod protein FlgB
VDTPNYKARDIDFKSALSAASNQFNPANLGLARTSSQHLDTSGSIGGGGEPALMYRNPISPSLDGNTVESHREKAEFSENSIRYQVSLTFMTSRIENMLRSIKGE